MHSFSWLRRVMVASSLAAPLWIIGINQLGVVARGEPSWARKYKADCTLCHTVYPRLNRTGYEFKRLGYRLPREVESAGRGAQAASHQPFVVKKEYKPQPETAESAAGRAVVERLNCASCHLIGGKGGQIGPPLDGVGGRRTAEFLREHITNPEEHAKRFPELHENKPNRMPHPNATPEEIKQMVAYLRTLPEPAGGFVVRPHEHGPLPDSAPSANFVPVPPSDASRAGEKLYLDMGCAACHSIGGSGGEFGPKLDGIGARRNREFIAAHITNPQLHSQRFPNEHTGEATMPPTNASPDQIQQITEYLETLAGTSQGVSEIRKNRIQDYLAISYIPSMDIEQGGGDTKTTFEKRDLIIYAAGPVGRYFSFFVQPTPATEEEGFGNKFEMAQGLFNYGGARNFLQVRFGQMFNLRNAGFGGTDRGFTETLPFIFQAANGFSPAGLGRGASLEYTLHGTSTFKVFGNVNEAPELEAEGESDEGVPELKRSRTYGAVWEQVIGSKGLSGFSVEFAGGRTPVLFGDGQQSQLRFQRYTVVANKSFLDKKNAERLNAIFGYSLLRDNRVLGLDADGRSHGQGYFAEIDAVPIVGHVGCYGRFDQIRETTLLNGNTIRGGTVGVIYDPVRYARVLFEYQRVPKLEIPNRYTIGLQFNF
jgi:mono/diheme cytochrome c family protein